MISMQRYRVNYPLLIGLAVGGVAAIACTYFLWKFQVTRNANRLLDKANVADAEGNVEDAFQSLVQFVRLRKDQDLVEVNGRTVNPRVLLGEVSIKLAEQDDRDLQ